MKLHWSPRSPFVRYVMVVAHEKNVASRFELTRSAVAMARPNAALMADNPLSKIPTLVLADGAVLVDSRVIARYFDVIGEGPRLFPEFDEKGAKVHSGEALALGHLDALLLWRNELIRPAGAQLAELLAAFEIKNAAMLARYGEVNHEGPATAITADQVATACALSYLDFRFDFLDWRSGHPQLAAWYEAMKGRPSFEATEPSKDEEAQ